MKYININITNKLSVVSPARAHAVLMSAAVRPAVVWSVVYGWLVVDGGDGCSMVSLQLPLVRSPHQHTVRPLASQSLQIFYLR